MDRHRLKPRQRAEQVGSAGRPGGQPGAGGQWQCEWFEWNKVQEQGMAGKYTEGSQKRQQAPPMEHTCKRTGGAGWQPGGQIWQCMAEETLCPTEWAAEGGEGADGEATRQAAQLTWRAGGKTAG